MAFSELIGQNQAKQRLGVALTGEPGHAFLLVGPSGIGKKTLAREFAKGLLCAHPTADGACGTCPNCHYMQAGTHPDYKELLLPAGEKNIKVADVRSKILSDVGIMSQIADRKVYLIDADGLAEEGQNALLKTLEEPPKHVVFLLTVSDESKLLPTILSRTVSIRLLPNTEEEVKKVLLERNPDIQPQEAELFARFSGGVIGYALGLAESNWLVNDWEEVTDLILRIPEISRTELLTDVYTFFDEEKEHFRDILSLMSMVYDEMAICATDASSVCLHGEAKKDKMVSVIKKYKLDVQKIGKCNAILTTAAKAHKSNGNFEMIVCRMLLALKKENSNG
ncbi:MAG: DNA polymerase III subunit [Clostridiales bacterium]|nr:DNA polymerase III subunit [Clostridiales bacterium]